MCYAVEVSFSDTRSNATLNSKTSVIFKLFRTNLINHYETNPVKRINTHTHTHIYIYIYCVCVCVFVTLWKLCKTGRVRWEILLIRQVVWEQQLAFSDRMQYWVTHITVYKLSGFPLLLSPAKWRLVTLYTARKHGKSNLLVILAIKRHVCVSMSGANIGSIILELRESRAM